MWLYLFVFYNFPFFKNFRVYFFAAYYPICLSKRRPGHRWYLAAYLLKFFNNVLIWPDDLLCRSMEWKVFMFGWKELKQGNYLLAGFCFNMVDNLRLRDLINNLRLGNLIHYEWPFLLRYIYIIRYIILNDWLLNLWVNVDIMLMWIGYVYLGVKVIDDWVLWHKNIRYFNNGISVLNDVA